EPGHPGYSGGVPPNAGHRSWKEHQPHSFDVLGRKTPSLPSPSILAHRSPKSRSKYSSSSREGIKNIESNTFKYNRRSCVGITPEIRQYTTAYNLIWNAASCEICDSGVWP